MTSQAGEESIAHGTQSVTQADQRRVRRVFWYAFALLSLITSIWALATPLASAPDENAHLVKAASVVRGELRGTSNPDNPGSGRVTVPAIYAATLQNPVCFAFKGEVPAGCAPALPAGADAAEPTEAATWMIRNNPLYYAIVGIPSAILPPGIATLYAMRLVSAVLCSAVLAWGLRAVAELSARSWPILAVATAVTPMVVYLNSVVGNSGLEISASLTLWLSLLVLVRAPDAARLHSRVAGIAIVSVLLVNTRGLSPLYIAAIVLSVAVLVGPWRTFWSVLTDRRTWPWLGVVVLGTIPALWWTLSAGTLEGGGAARPEYTFLTTANRTFFDTGDFLLVSMGRFGWFDTDLPMLLTLTLAAVLGLPVLLALAGRRRARVAMLGVIAVAVLGPVLVHAWQASNVGYIWTGRYSMPLFAGVAVVSGFLCRDEARTLPGWVGHRIAGVVVPLVAMAHVVAFLFVVRRFTVGSTGSWRAILAGNWAPPVPVAVLVPALVVLVAAGAWLLLRMRDDDDAREELAPSPREDPALSRP